MRARLARLDAARRKAAKHLATSRKAETRYVLDVLRILAPIHAHALAAARALLPSEATRHDAKSLDPRVKAAAAKHILQTVPPAFDRMAADVSKKNARGMGLIGIRPRDIGIGPTLMAKRVENVKLITNATNDFLDQVNDILADNFGTRVEDLADELEERVGVSKSRATLIARDQTNKANAAITQHRQTAAGIEKFVWSTSHDERVRASHAELDGRTFTWAEGLPADVADEVDEEEGATPGNPINCRCVPIPVLDDDEEGEGEPAPDDEEEAAE